MMINDIIVGMLGNTAYDIFKNITKKCFGSDSKNITEKVYEAFNEASQVFFNKYGNQFGEPSYSFLARQENLERILESVSFSTEMLEAKHISIQGFNGVQDATEDAIAFFVSQLKHEMEREPFLKERLALKSLIYENFNKQEKILQSVLAFEKPLQILKESIYENWSKKVFEGKAYINIPHHNLNYIEREEVLKRISEVLQFNNIIALIGLGGVGKTQIAVRYTNKYLQDYDIICWFHAENKEVLKMEYFKFAEILNVSTGYNINNEDEKLDDIINKVNIKLYDYKTLFIFDNANQICDIKMYLPKSGKVIISSRKDIWKGIAKQIKINVLPREKSIEFLLKRSEEDENSKQYADKLAEKLGDLPLALEQAGAYISNKRSVNIEKYIKKFEELETRNESLVEQELLSKDEDLVFYNKSVATTWEITFDEIKNKFNAAIPIMEMCAFLSPEQIPIHSFSSISEYLVSSFKELENYLSEKHNSIQDVFDFLSKYSVIEWEKGSNSISMHRLVQQVIRIKCINKNCADEYKYFVVLMLGKVFRYDYNIPEIWELCELYLPHVMVVKNKRYMYEYKFCKAVLSGLFNQVGNYLTHKLNLYEAELYFNLAYELYSEEYGEKNENIASLLCNIGNLNKELGDYSKEKENFEKAYNILYEINQSGDLFTHVLIGFGISLIDVGNYVQAELHLKNAANRLEAYSQENSFEYSRCMRSMSIVYERLEDVPKALLCIEKSLEIDIKIFGPVHHNISDDLIGRGNIYRILGKYNKSKIDLEQSKTILENNYPNEKIYLASNLDHYGCLLLEMCDFEEAMKSFTKAIDIYNEILCTGHPEYATCLINIGDLMLRRGNFEKNDYCREAKIYFSKALEINVKFLGMNHIRTAESFTYLGRAQQAIGEYEGAIKSLNQANTIIEKILGLGSKQMVRNLNNLGCTYLDSGDYRNAYKYLVESYQISKKIYGTHHENSILVLNNVNNCLEFMDIKKFETPLVRPKLGRNDRCVCGSEKKYKHCCGKK